MVMDNFKVKTATGVKEFIQGQVIPVASNVVNMLIDKGKIIALDVMMFDQYKNYIRTATNDMTVEYLNAMEPARLKVIRETMERLDNYFNTKDYQNFMKTIKDSLNVLEQDIY